MLKALSERSSSFKTLLKPWRAKESAFKIWSPRLAAAESGIRRLGLRKARSSQMELAPAREMTTSAAANRCFKGASTYSYCTYPSVPIRLSSRLPFPQICITWNVFKSCGRIFRTAVFTATDPRLPPMIRRTGLSSVK